MVGIFFGRSRKRSGFPLQVLAEAVGFPLQSLTCKCVLPTLHSLFYLFYLLPPTRQRYRSVPVSRTPSSTPAGSMPENVRKAGRDKRNTFARAVTRSFDFIETFRAPSRSNKFPDVCPGSPLLSYPFFQPLFSSLGFAVTERITLCLRNFPPVSATAIARPSAKAG
uniref:hypothetical protein n=1 Tax=Bacteroides xylanisolvens TaxID=371601 RepID=UPI0035646005